jgi:hypothetical protein
MRAAGGTQKWEQIDGRDPGRNTTVSIECQACETRLPNEEPNWNPHQLGEPPCRNGDPLTIRPSEQTLIVRNEDANFEFETDRFQIRRGDEINFKVDLRNEEIVVRRDYQTFGRAHLLVGHWHGKIDADEEVRRYFRPLRNCATPNVWPRGIGHADSVTTIFSQMQEPNPYSPSTPGSVVDAEAGIDNWRRLKIAFLIGLGCCLVGPIFLWLYWAIHGIDGGIIQTASFFALIYIVPSLTAVAIGLAAAFFLSPICPRIDDIKRWAVVICVAVVSNAMGIGLLLTGQLDFGVDIVAIELPAFSVACALASLTTTFVSLAFS